MCVLIICQSLPDPFPAFLFHVHGTENYASQTFGFCIGPANQGQWKKVEEKPGYFFQPGLCSICVSFLPAAASSLWLVCGGSSFCEGGLSSWAPGALAFPF